MFGSYWSDDTMSDEGEPSAKRSREEDGGEDRKEEKHEADEEEEVAPLPSGWEKRISTKSCKF